jgi:glutaredoxin 3
VRAKALLDARGISHEEVALDDEPGFRARLHELTGVWTAPHVVIDGAPIGGYTMLRRLDRDGRVVGRLAA